MDSLDHSLDHFVEHEGTYLLSHSVGLPVAGTRTALNAVIDTWQSHTHDAWSEWLDVIETFRAALARLLGTHSSSICPQSNVSSALTKILGAIRPTLGTDQPTVLMSEHAFPSLGFVCKYAGFDVRFIRANENAMDPTIWRSHLDGVDVALITQVHSNTGELLPVAAICDAIAHHDVVSIVDVAQSVGIIPIEVPAWDVDFVIGSCVKWLSGGSGAGWLWANPTMIDRCEPRDVGWFSHSDPFEFDIHHFEYAEDALRFWGGTPSVLPFAVAQHSITAVAQLGVASIREYNQRQLDRIVSALGQRVVSPHDRDARGGTCIVAGNNDDIERLARSNIFVDGRKSGLRISPHLHTSPDDIDQTVAALGTRPASLGSRHQAV